MTCDETDGSVILSTNNNAVTIYTHLAGSTHNGSGSPGRRRDPGSRTNHKFDSCRVAPAATRLSALLPLDRPAPPPVHMGRIAVDWPVGRPHDWRVLFTAPLKFEPWLCHLDPLLRPTPVNSREQSNHLQVSDQKSDCRAWITRHPK